MFPRWSTTFAFALAQGTYHCLAFGMLAGYREHAFHGKGPISGQQPLCQELIWLIGNPFRKISLCQIIHYFIWIFNESQHLSLVPALSSLKSTMWSKAYSCTAMTRKCYPILTFFPPRYFFRLLFPHFQGSSFYLAGGKNQGFSWKTIH